MKGRKTNFGETLKATFSIEQGCQPPFIGAYIKEGGIKKKEGRKEERTI